MVSKAELEERKKRMGAAYQFRESIGLKHGVEYHYICGGVCRPPCTFMRRLDAEPPLFCAVTGKRVQWIKGGEVGI